MKKKKILVAGVLLMTTIMSGCDSEVGLIPPEDGASMQSREISVEISANAEQPETRGGSTVSVGRFQDSQGNDWEFVTPFGTVIELAAVSEGHDFGSALTPEYKYLTNNYMFFDFSSVEVGEVDFNVETSGEILAVFMLDNPESETVLVQADISNGVAEFSLPLFADRKSFYLSLVGQ